MTPLAAIRLGVLVAIAMLALAVIGRWPYDFFMLLRWVVCAACIAAMSVQRRGRKQAWTLVLVGLAVLFNPVIPVYLSRSTWRILDLGGAVTLALWLAQREDGK
jgi:hypothetical protein